MVREQASMTTGRTEEEMTQEGPERTPLRRVLYWVLVVSLVGIATSLAVVIARRSPRGFWAQLLFTFVGAALGVLLLGVQTAARRKRPLIAIAGMTFVAISQATFLLLVWTDLLIYGILWRLCWVATAPAVFLTHHLLVRSMSKESWGLVERGIAWCGVAAGVMVLLLGFRRDLFAELSGPIMIAGAVPAAGTVIGILYLYFRWLLGRLGPGGISRRVMAAAMILSHMMMLVVGFYAARAMARREGLEPNDFAEEVRQEVPRQVWEDLYAMQSSIATFLGDTRIVERPFFISLAQVEEARGKLRPGDLILVRRNGYPSNLFMPGFWTHSALYVGTAADLKELGIATQPLVAKHLRRDEEGGAVIEAVSEGVIFTTLEHAIHADYAAVLRPRQSKEKRALAIVRAFDQVGKPYDFDFDFSKPDRLICTELLCLAYKGMLTFELTRVMGRDTLPAVGIAQQYVKERGRSDRQMDFVLFLDADPVAGAAHWASEETFCESIERPRALVER